MILKLIILFLFFFTNFISSENNKELTQIFLTILPTNSQILTQPFLVIDPKINSRNNELEGTAYGYLNVSLLETSQIRVSLTDSTFDSTDTLEISISPFLNSYNSKVELWNGYAEAFQQPLAVNIAKGTAYARFKIHYKGLLKKEPKKINGNIEFLIYTYN